MLTPSRIHHHDRPTDGPTHLDRSFGLLCWNVHKQNRTDDRLGNFLRERFPEGIDLLLLQEVELTPAHRCVLEGYAFDAAANLELRRARFGVLTASKVPAIEARAFLTRKKEGIWGTHKSFLLSRYVFEDGTPLWVANVHAINFRENRAFRDETERLFGELSGYDGPLIVAGDLNTWNASRLRHLLTMTRHLRLEHLRPDRRVRSFRSYPLDHVFYRDLRVLDTRIDTTHAVSDHHPIYVRFEKP